MFDQGCYAVRAMLIFLLERSSSIWVVDSSALCPLPVSRGRLLPKEMILQRFPAPDLCCLATAGDLGDGALGFDGQTVKY